MFLVWCFHGRPRRLFLLLGVGANNVARRQQGQHTVIVGPRCVMIAACDKLEIQFVEDFLLVREIVLIIAFLSQASASALLSGSKDRTGSVKGTSGVTTNDYFIASIDEGYIIAADIDVHMLRINAHLAYLTKLYNLFVVKAFSPQPTHPPPYNRSVTTSQRTPAVRGASVAPVSSLSIKFARPEVVLFADPSDVNSQALVLKV